MIRFSRRKIADGEITGMLARLLDVADANKLINRPEDHFFDRKSVAVSGAGIQKALVSFANADGGELLVGVEDGKNNGGQPTWLGHLSVEAFNGVLQAINEISPQIPCSMTFLTCRDHPGYVLLVDVEKSSQVHQTPAKEVYVRKGAQSLPIKDAERLVALRFAKGLASYEDVEVPGVPAETIVESEELKDFLNDFSPRSDPLEFCVNENLIGMKTWDPKVCGLVLFGKNPSSLIPTRAGVRVTRYETRDDDPERDHLADSTLLELPIYQLIHAAVACIAETMSKISIWTVKGLEKVNYPPEAVWEIVANALLHRDYSIADDVHVRIFDNRIEVQSPGRLPGFVTVDNILNVRYSRNKQIVRTLARYKNPPNKDMGEGLNTAFQKMKEWRLKSPVIEEKDGSVIVTIPHTSLAKPEELVMEFVKKNGAITNRQGRDITGIRSENAMKNVFYSLRDAGLLCMEPKGNKTEWHLASRDGGDGAGCLFR